MTELIAKKMHTSVTNYVEKLQMKNCGQVSVEDQIKALEKELEQDDDSTSSDSESEEKPSHETSLFLPPTLKKLPYCCRPCGFQGKSMAEFEAHRQSKEHAKISDQTMKKLNCPQCRKQFNSLVQYEDHCKGKLHQQNLAAKKRKYR